MALLVSLLCILVGLVWYYLKRRFSYWRRHGVEEWKATSIFGNFGQVFAFKATIADVADECYKRLKGPVGGYYYLWKPILLVKDVNLVKKILIKHFDHFTDRPRFMNFHDTDVIVRSLFYMEGETWRTFRMAFAHLFTPKRLKIMSDQVEKVCINSTDRFLTSAKNGEDIDLDVYINIITIDVITKSFIGISLNDQKKFHTISSFFNHIGIYDALKSLLYQLHPKIYNFFRMTSLDKKIYESFHELAKDVLEEIEATNIVNEDLFGFLVKCKNGENKEIGKIEVEEIATHIFTFFFAGYETTATTTSFILYELSKNPDVQNRLRNDIENSVKNNGLTYSALKNIPYLDWTMKEGTRMYPPLGVLKRVCTKPYKFQDFEIPVGTEIVVPLRAFHYDREYFENPSVFNPERFADGEPDVFMPFGKGPRLCIGIKLADMAVKLLVASILLKFDLKPSDKNKEPLKFQVTTGISNKSADGVWAKMELRQ